MSESCPRVSLTRERGAPVIGSCTCKLEAGLLRHLPDLLTRIDLLDESGDERERIQDSHCCLATMPRDQLLDLSAAAFVALARRISP